MLCCNIGNDFSRQRFLIRLAAQIFLTVRFDAATAV